MTPRINDPPLPEGRKKVYVPSDLQAAIRASNRESKDPLADQIVLMYALAYQEASGWVDMPYWSLGREVYHIDERRLAKAIKRLTAQGILEEHPDNFHYQQRVAKRVRVLVKVKREQATTPKKEEAEHVSVFRTPHGTANIM